MEMISAPAPSMLMQASVKQALRRLDNVDPGVKEFFKGAAKTVADGADPVDALAAALGCMSGFTEVPKDRSLLTQVGSPTPLNTTTPTPHHSPHCIPTTPTLTCPRLPNHSHPLSIRPDKPSPPLLQPPTHQASLLQTLSPAPSEPMLQQQQLQTFIQH